MRTILRPAVLLGVLCLSDAVEPTTQPAADPAPITEPQPPRQAYLGLAIDAAATAFEGHGLVVLRVEPGSPAAVMGLASGDRLLRIDGQPLTTSADLQRLLGTKHPGERITIDALRLQGAGQKPEAFTCAGLVQGLPRTRTSSLGTQIDALQAKLAELETKAKEPTLAEILERLQRIEADLPKAAAAFKRIYPDGEFRIVISLEVTSHKTAPTPLAIEVGGRPAVAAEKTTP